MWDVPRMLRSLLGRAASGEQADASVDREHDVESLRQRLGVSQDRLRGVFESSVIGVVVGDLDGAIREANDAFLWMVGYSREDLEAGRLNWIELTLPEHACSTPTRSDDSSGAAPTRRSRRSTCGGTAAASRS